MKEKRYLALFLVFVTLCLTLIGCGQNKELKEIEEAITPLMQQYVNTAEFQVTEARSNSVTIKCPAYKNLTADLQHALIKAIRLRIRLIGLEEHTERKYEKLSYVSIYVDDSENKYFYVPDEIYKTRSTASQNGTPDVNVLKPGLYWGKDSIGKSVVVKLDE